MEKDASASFVLAVPHFAQSRAAARPLSLSLSPPSRPLPHPTLTGGPSWDAAYGSPFSVSARDAASEIAAKMEPATAAPNGSLSPPPPPPADVAAVAAVDDGGDGGGEGGEGAPSAGAGARRVSSGGGGGGCGRVGGRCKCERACAGGWREGGKRRAAATRPPPALTQAISPCYSPQRRPRRPRRRRSRARRGSWTRPLTFNGRLGGGGRGRAGERRGATKKKQKREVWRATLVWWTKNSTSHRVTSL